ncbi:MAG: hypothetical protein ACXVGH_12590, partial [Mycobacteriales bacterium]
MATVRPDEPIRPRVAADPARRRRRPSGEPPPLPRQVPPGTRAYAALVLATAALEAALAVPLLRRWVTAADLAVVHAVASLRTAPLTDVLRSVDGLGASWLVRTGFWLTLGVLLAARRLHHLLAYLAVVLTTVLLVTVLDAWQGRPRPAGVVLVGPWQGYAHPSAPVALLALVLVGVRSTLLPVGRWRA